MLIHIYLLQDYGINSILYQRGIYPSETFQPAEHFGIMVYMTTKEEIKSFLKTVLGQIQGQYYIRKNAWSHPTIDLLLNVNRVFITDWICEKNTHKISLIISNPSTQKVLEQWDFKINYDSDENGNAVGNGKVVGKKDLKLIQKEIRDVLRQISGTVSFLPLLDCLCKYTA